MACPLILHWRQEFCRNPPLQKGLPPWKESENRFQRLGSGKIVKSSGIDTYITNLCSMGWDTLPDGWVAVACDHASLQSGIS